MAEAAALLDTETQEPAATPAPRRPAVARRDKDLLGRSTAPIRRALDKLYDTIHRGFENQADRSDDQQDFWDCYNCTLNQNQFYDGNAEIYVPIVRDAVNARATRFINQLFPASGRYVEATSADGHQPAEIIALLDHYIRTRRFKTQIAKPLSVNGDVEGQYNLLVDWAEIERRIVSRETRGPVIEQDGTPVELPPEEGEEIEDIVEEDVVEGAPVCEVLHDCDVLVLPATADTVEEALEVGGVVAIVRRWSKEKIKAMAAGGEIREGEAKDLAERMGRAANDRDVKKSLAEAVGIRAKGEHAVVWEVWIKLPLGENGYAEDGERRLCRLFLGPERTPLGAARNPYWNDRCPLLSAPVVKVAGVFKGQSLIEPIASLQYEANDAANEGADSAHYAAMPLMRVSPEVTQPIILNLGAILRARTGELEMITFPDLTPRAVTRIQYCTQAIFTSLGVNPAMVPHQTGRPGAKRNQAEIAMEQQVDLLTTAEAVSVLEEGIFSPLMGWMVDLDYQYRDRELAVRMFGTMGIHAQMQDIPPLQNRARYDFRWWGVEQARNAMQQQQQVAWINVARGLRQELAAEGYTLKIGPVLESSAMATFGARQGALVLEDRRHQSSLSPQIENELMLAGHIVPVQPLDNDIEHIKTHAGDPVLAMSVNGKTHIQEHLQQMKLKQAAQAQQVVQQMQGGGGQGGGQPGGQRNRGGGMPRQGAQPAGPRLVAQRPAGAIHPDQMARAGALGMPRKT